MCVVVCHKARAQFVEHAEWQAQARRILEETACADNFNEVEIDQTIIWDNGSWADHEVSHLCTPLCPCKGDEEQAFQCTLAVYQRTLGPNCEEALEYRWKHMESANAWCCRLRAQHDMGYRFFVAHGRKRISSKPKQMLLLLLKLARMLRTNRQRRKMP